MDDESLNPSAGEASANNAVTQSGYPQGASGGQEDGADAMRQHDVPQAEVPAVVSPHVAASDEEAGEPAEGTAGENTGGAAYVAGSNPFLAFGEDSPRASSGSYPYEPMPSYGSSDGDRPGTFQPGAAPSVQTQGVFDGMDTYAAPARPQRTVASDAPDDEPTIAFQPYAVAENSSDRGRFAGYLAEHSASSSSPVPESRGNGPAAGFAQPSQVPAAATGMQAPAVGASPAGAAAAVMPVQPGDEPATADARHRHAWPWIVLAVLVVALAAAAALCVQHYQDRALPGVTLWGRSVAGQTQQQIADGVTKLVNDTTVTVTYDGKSEQITLPDLGYTVDADSIAKQALDAKRSEGILQRYLPGVTVNVDPSLGDASAADPAKLGDDFGVASTPATDAAVALNSDRTQYQTTPATAGTGLSATNAAEQLLTAIGDPSARAQPVQLQVDDVQPAVTDDMAGQAAATLNNLIANPIKITGNGGDITTLGVDAIDASYSIDATGTTPDGSQRSGCVLFDSAKLQSYYETAIKANYQADEQDADVIVNNDGEVIKTNVEGHPGVTVADGGDANVGTDGAKAFANGSGTVTIDATVTPMQTKQTKRHTVVDLSDKKLYAYENDQVIKTFNIADGAGTADDGSCTGDLCTPTGDFKIWWKLDSQDMKGTLTLSDGSTTSWNAPGVKYVNYFSHSGCAIHRINARSAINDADVPTSGAESHGCIGLGWDVAEWYYEWADYNETVHIQQ